MFTFRVQSTPTVWVNTTQYQLLQRVTHNNHTWEANQANTGSEPTDTNTNWFRVSGANASNITIDNVVTRNSVNPVTSAALFGELEHKYDSVAIGLNETVAGDNLGQYEVVFRASVDGTDIDREVFYLPRGVIKEINTDNALTVIGNTFRTGDVVLNTVNHILYYVKSDTATTLTDKAEVIGGNGGANDATLSNLVHHFLDGIFATGTNVFRGSSTNSLNLTLTGHVFGLQVTLADAANPFEVNELRTFRWAPTAADAAAGTNLEVPANPQLTIIEADAAVGFSQFITVSTSRRYTPDQVNTKFWRLLEVANTTNNVVALNNEGAGRAYNASTFPATDAEKILPTSWDEAILPWETGEDYHSGMTVQVDGRTYVRTAVPNGRNVLTAPTASQAVNPENGSNYEILTNTMVISDGEFRFFHGTQNNSSSSATPNVANRFVSGAWSANSGPTQMRLGFDRVAGPNGTFASDGLTNLLGPANARTTTGGTATGAVAFYFSGNQSYIIADYAYHFATDGPLNQPFEHIYNLSNVATVGNVPAEGTDILVLRADTQAAIPGFIPNTTGLRPATTGDAGLLWSISPTDTNNPFITATTGADTFIPKSIITADNTNYAISKSGTTFSGTDVSTITIPRSTFAVTGNSIMRFRDGAFSRINANAVPVGAALYQQLYPYWILPFDATGSTAVAGHTDYGLRLPSTPVAARSFNYTPFLSVNGSSQTTVNDPNGSPGSTVVDRATSSTARNGLILAVPSNAPTATFYARLTYSMVMTTGWANHNYSGTSMGRADGNNFMENFEAWIDHVVDNRPNVTDRTDRIAFDTKVASKAAGVNNIDPQGRIIGSGGGININHNSNNLDWRNLYENGGANLNTIRDLFLTQNFARQVKLTGSAFVELHRTDLFEIKFGVKGNGLMVGGGIGNQINASNFVPGTGSGISTTTNRVELGDRGAFGTSGSVSATNNNHANDNWLYVEIFQG